MLRRLINDAVNQAARTSTHKAVGTPLYNIVWYSISLNQDTIGDDIHDAVANAVRNVDLNVYAKVDDIIGTKI